MASLHRKYAPSFLNHCLAPERWVERHHLWQLIFFPETLVHRVWLPPLRQPGTGRTSPKGLFHTRLYRTLQSLEPHEITVILIRSTPCLLLLSEVHLGPSGDYRTTHSSYKPVGEVADSGTQETQAAGPPACSAWHSSQWSPLP